MNDNKERVDNITMFTENNKFDISLNHNDKKSCNCDCNCHMTQLNKSMNDYNINENNKDNKELKKNELIDNINNQVKNLKEANLPNIKSLEWKTGDSAFGILVSQLRDVLCSQKISNAFEITFMKKMLQTCYSIIKKTSNFYNEHKNTFYSHKIEDNDVNSKDLKIWKYIFENRVPEYIIKNQLYELPEDDLLLCQFKKDINNDNEIYRLLKSYKLYKPNTKLHSSYKEITILGSAIFSRIIMIIARKLFSPEDIKIILTINNLEYKMNKSETYYEYLCNSIRLKEKEYNSKINKEIYSIHRSQWLTNKLAPFLIEMMKDCVFLIRDMRTNIRTANEYAKKEQLDKGIKNRDNIYKPPHLKKKFNNKKMTSYQNPSFNRKEIDRIVIDKPKYRIHSYYTYNKPNDYIVNYHQPLYYHKREPYIYPNYK